MRNVYAVFVTASPNPRHNLYAIFVDGGDKVGGEVAVPDDTFADTVLLGGSAGLAVLWVVSRERDFPNESAPKAGLTRHLFPLNKASIKQVSFRVGKLPGPWLGLLAL